MKLGVVFPQTEIGNDPAVVRDYGQAAEALGYEHVLAFDHVLGGNAATHELRGPYKHTHAFHEPFVLFGFLAAVTQRMEFVTGIIILPQRQTALVAKQAAALDVLSGGRLRLGVAIGWNHVEYEALGMDFGDRARRIEEQIEVMRLLWTNELITFEGQDHRITDAGLNPLPVQRPYPDLVRGSCRLRPPADRAAGRRVVPALRAGRRRRGRGREVPGLYPRGRPRSGRGRDRDLARRAG